MCAHIHSTHTHTPRPRYNIIIIYIYNITFILYYCKETNQSDRHVRYSRADSRGVLFIARAVNFWFWKVFLRNVIFVLAENPGEGLTDVADVDSILLLLLCAVRAGYVSDVICLSPVYSLDAPPPPPPSSFIFSNRFIFRSSVFFFYAAMRVLVSADKSHRGRASEYGANVGTLARSPVNPFDP